VCVAVRDTIALTNKNPLTFFAVKQRIEAGLSDYAGRFVVVPVPNQRKGRDVGYAIEQLCQRHVGIDLWVAS
jgi:hypothetical protein